MSGNHIFSIIFTILAKIIPLNPSYILLILPCIDLSVSRLAKGYWNEDKNYSIFFNISDQKEILSPIDIKNLNEKKYFLLIDLFINILNTFSINYYIFNRPYKTNHSILNNMNKYIEEYCLQKKYNFINFNSYFNGDDNIDNYFYDNLHLNEYGSIKLGNILANCIYDNILSKNL